MVFSCMKMKPLHQKSPGMSILLPKFSWVIGLQPISCIEFSSMNIFSCKEINFHA